ncbi:DNA cytosine methyltransferase [Cereibacter sphaeroides]|nr:DNA cytosine methyltransferase [Cereibacter sphaeroides]
MSGAYYNEFDPGAAAWLRELIKRGLIADGEVDDRSILDVSPDDLRGFTQWHFFAGIGGWSRALRLAGWPDDRSVWTGSPPCQPFSAAGKGLSRDDPRHLAPHFVRLVRAVRPGVLFGEQVASAEVFGKAAGRARGGAAVAPPWAWLDDLSDRLEAARYAVGASDIPAAGVGAFHIRQRTFFVAVAHEWLADAERIGRERRRAGEAGASGREEAFPAACGSRDACGLADAERRAAERHGYALGAAPGGVQGPSRQQWLRDDAGHGDPACGLGNGLRSGLEGRFWNAGVSGRESGTPEGQAVIGAGVHAAVLRCDDRRLADADGWNASAEREQPGGQHGQQPQDGGVVQRDRPGPAHGIWDAPDWLLCRDGKWRPAQSSVLGMADEIPAELVRSGAFVPASFPLAPKAKGDARRVMRLRGYGNAIDPVTAAEFISTSETAIREVMGAAA